MAEPRNWKPRKPISLPVFALRAVVLPLFAALAFSLGFAWLIK